MTPAVLAKLFHNRTAAALRQLDEQIVPGDSFDEQPDAVRDVLELVAASLLEELDDELEADVESYRAALSRSRARRAAPDGGF